eukprot:TRINITY_DN6890_c0_g1_i1.p1 TRINITY_DN6890_c0_g1~~TRINITY_DN6890_c0_g1_i1.p1  ORF type:complete len:208 (+),score=32.22 TRINITY_DN6890_c0_g1_i1:62-685(+)
MQNHRAISVLSFINGQFSVDPEGISLHETTTLEEFFSVCQVEMGLARTPTHMYLLPYGERLRSTDVLQTLRHRERVIVTDALGDFRERNLPPRHHTTELTPDNIIRFQTMLSQIDQSPPRSSREMASSPPSSTVSAGQTTHISQLQTPQLHGTVSAPGVLGVGSTRTSNPGSSGLPSSRETPSPTSGTPSPTSEETQSSSTTPPSTE